MTRHLPRWLYINTFAVAIVGSYICDWYGYVAVVLLFVLLFCFRVASRFDLPDL